MLRFFKKSKISEAEFLAIELTKLSVSAMDINAKPISLSSNTDIIQIFYERHFNFALKRLKQDKSTQCF